MSTGRVLVLGIIGLSLFITILITALLVNDMRNLAQKMHKELTNTIDVVAETPKDKEKSESKDGKKEATLGDRVAEITMQSGEDQVVAVATDLANKIRGAMDVPFSSARTISDTILAYKDFCVKNEVEPDRTLMKALLKDILARDDQLQAIWLAFEPNEFDGNDEAFIGKEVRDDPTVAPNKNYVSVGQFIPWFYKTDEGILENVLDDMYFKEQDYYRGAFESEQEYITNPYDDETSLISTIAIPLREKGKTIGAIGVDVRISDLQQIIDESKPLETGIGMLVSPDGKFAIHPKKDDSDWMEKDEDDDKKLVPKKIADLPGLEETAKYLKEGKQAAYISKTILGDPNSPEMQVIHIPVQFGNYPEPWTVIVAVPLEQVMKSRIEASTVIAGVVQNMEKSSAESDKLASQSIRRACIVGVVVLLVSLVLGVLFARYVNRKVDEKDHWYRQILDTVHAPISVVDLNKSITFVNKVAKSLLGKTDAECEKCPHANVWGPEMDQPVALLESRQEKMTKCDFKEKNWEVYTDFLLQPNGMKNGMIEFFKDVTDRENVINLAQGIEKVVDKVVAQMELITDDSAQLSAGSEEQAASLDEITHNMNTMSEQTRRNADNADNANRLTNESVSAAKNGQSRMSGVIEQMTQISANASNMQKVIKTIDDIAFQTNLLALNAAVEAARAGTHGKGFAVVAEEVRNLAARSAKAAQETEELIIKSNKQIDDGVKMVHQTSEALNVIAGQVAQATELVANIAASSKEQAEEVGKINATVGQVGSVTQQNSQTAAQTASVAHDLNEEIHELSVMMQKFK